MGGFIIQHQQYLLLTPTAVEGKINKILWNCNSINEQEKKSRVDFFYNDATQAKVTRLSH